MYKKCGLMSSAVYMTFCHWKKVLKIKIKNNKNNKKYTQDIEVYRKPQEWVYLKICVVSRHYFRHWHSAAQHYGVTQREEGRVTFSASYHKTIWCPHPFISGWSARHMDTAVTYTLLRELPYSSHLPTKLKNLLKNWKT